MNPGGGRYYWLRILLANVVGALAILGIGGAFSAGLAGGELLKAAGAAFVYSNAVGCLLAVTMPRVGRRCVEQAYPGRWIIIFATICIVAIVGTFLASVILLVVGYIPRARFWDWVRGSMTMSVGITAVIGGAVTAYEMLRHRLEDATVALRTKERDEADARRVAAESHLASLESRVQPHFLFNTLNSIAALIHEDPGGAEKMTGQLASLLRSSLDQQTPLVRIDEELRIVRDYLDIERVRFGDRLRFEIQVEDAAAAARVPRLAVQTLVENSVKYAVSPSRGGAAIAVRATARGDRARVEVEDNGPGFAPSAERDGHGLALVRSRLEMMFGDRASLGVDSAPGRTIAAIELPLDPSMQCPPLGGP